MVTGLVLRAPLTGWVLPLAQVDDPVFGDGMMGDGVAIDPLVGLLTAPAKGEVVAIAPTAHSITLRLDNGADLLIHLGLETVALGGAGFEIQARPGARVDAGDPLIAFDLEALSRRAKSLVTPVVLLSEGYRLHVLACDQSVAAGDPLIRIEQLGDSAPAAGSDGTIVTVETNVPLAHGIHARPAARIGAVLKSFAADVWVAANGREGNARSTVGLLTLGIRQGDSITITARGADAQAAVNAVRDLIASGMGESRATEAPPTRSRESDPGGPKLHGVSAAAGIAAGPIAHLRLADLDLAPEGAGEEEELRALNEAVASLRRELDEDLARDREGVAFAHRSILDDPELGAAATRHIQGGRSAAYAWREATRELSDQIRGTGNAFLIERIDDLIDVERRLVSRIVGGVGIEANGIPGGAIVVAETLLPSQFRALSDNGIAGIATAGGGPTSHVAILAASAGLPMVVALGERLLSVPDGTQVVLDADAGTLDLEPSEALVQKTKQAVASQAAVRADQHRAAQADCVIADGTRIEIFANLGSLPDAQHAVSVGAEGCGLLRTEFLFLDRDIAPGEEEQQQAYSAIAEALAGRPLIVRTLDIGGDKPVPYLDTIREDNPALGRRGVRISLARPDLLATQLRAILRGVPAAQCRIMVPMIVDVEELRAVRAILDDAARAVGTTGQIPLGVMIETPSAAVLADSIAAEADFLSVGTNDLSQYVLAVDRGNPAVAGMVDALHPAVLRLIAAAAKGAAVHGRQLGVCGGLASEPNAAAILIGLGATELSAVPAAVPAMKAAVRKLTLDGCRSIADQALALGSAQDVRKLLGEQRQ